MYALLFSLAFFLSCQCHLKAQALIMVRNDTAPDEIKEQASYYANLFGFDEQVLIVISFSHNVSDTNSGYTLYQNAHMYGGGHQVHIIISKKVNRALQLQTLAHEMVHARQFVEGTLVQCGSSSFIWEGKKCLNAKRIAYHHRPWEKEAQKVGNKIYHAYREKEKAAVLAVY